MVRWTRLGLSLLLTLAATAAIAQPVPSGLQYFGEPVALPRQPGTIVVATAVGDLTGDGLNDIVTVERPDKIVVHRADGVGGFTQQVSHVEFVGYGNSVRIEAMDADGDGDKDLLMLDANTTAADGYISVWPNTGGGWFVSAFGTYVSAVRWDRTYAIVDLDANGQQELVILGTNFGGRLFKYDAAGLTIAEDLNFKHVWYHSNGSQVFGSTPLAIGGEHLLADLSYFNSTYFQNCQVGRSLIGFRPASNASFNLCQNGFASPPSYSGFGGYTAPTPFTPPNYLPRQTTSGYGAAMTVSANTSYAVLPATWAGGTGWQVLSFAQISSQPSGQSANFLQLPFASPSYYAGNINDAVGTIDTDGGGWREFIIAGNNGARYVGMSQFSAPTTGLGSLNTLNATPARAFSARLGRTAGRDDLVLQSNGYALVYYDNGGAPTITVSAPNVTAPGGYTPTGQPIGLPVAINFPASGGVGPYTYRVYSGATVVGSGSSPVTVDMPAGGTYTVMAIDAEGMWSTATGTVTVGPPPVVTPLGVTLTSGGPYSADVLGAATASVTATPIAPQGAVSYSWSVDGGASIPTGSTPTISVPLFIGSHSVRVTVTDAWGRTSTATATIEVQIPASTGEPGATGATGATGPQGPPGPEGPQGPIGPMGPVGPQGPMGPAGAVGAAGADGAPGAKGDTGAPGADGAIGPAGPAGPAGTDGARGDRGDVGPIGPAGPTGPAGPQGERGETGIAGATGAIGPIGPIGAQGERGADGAIGPMGPAGSAGAQGERGADGAAGAAGPIGPTGAAGPQGDRGDVGPAGPAGPAGPQGERGETGAIGSTGAAGPAGAIGPQGERGADGAPGATGAIGPIGPAGPAGDDGAKGDRGDAGPSGPAGATGAQGPKGDTGNVGPAGSAGPMGPAGPAGPAGTATWPSGAILHLRQGAAPPPGFVRLGSYRQELNSGNPGRNDRDNDDRGRGNGNTIVIVIYMKQ